MLVREREAETEEKNESGLFGSITISNYYRGHGKIEGRKKPKSVRGNLELCVLIYLSVHTVIPFYIFSMPLVSKLR